MGTGERLRITVTGGAPWGFRLQGGGSYPIEVAKIRKKSFAFEAGLKEGDVVLAINGYALSGRSHQSAMDLVDMATNTLEFEVARSASGQGATRPMDPQRQLRIIPVVSGQENAGPGIVSSAQANFSTTDGNTRTAIHTEEYTMKSPSGKKITKTVTEQRVTRYGSGEGGLSPAQGQGHVSRSPNRSPVMWQPPSVSPAQSQSNISRNQSRSPTTWQPKSASPSPVAPYGSHSLNRQPAKQKGHAAKKENLDPILISEQAKWEARNGPQNVPTFKLENFGNHTVNMKINNSNNYVPKKVEDPRYPMFDVPKVDWSPQKKVQPPPPPPPQESAQRIKIPGPPVPPKPMSPCLSPIPFAQNERVIAGMEMHHPGMIRPPAQPNVAPAPPPPPMPPAPQKWNVPQIKKFRPGHFSAPMEEEDVPDYGTARPDHLPVFAPKVYFGPDDDSGLAMSPDQHSDISSSLGHNKTVSSADDVSEDDDPINAEKLLFSDSAFYDDSTHRFPTIDEQMSMCKKIAQSLTSAANNRAKGARMFAKRKRKANRWVHERNTLLGGSAYSSSSGDVADLNDLDSELYYDEGGNRPLFSFRIPNIAGQVSQGQKMSLSKGEFERLRLAAPRVDHHAVSPDTCFNIAADLHKGGKNKGAKLFQKRQARVEKFVIDDSNVNRAPVTPTKLEQILKSPHSAPTQQPSPWNAAAHGNVNDAFERTQRTMYLPKHTLATDNHPKLLEGQNFNKAPKGWMGSNPAHTQQSYYRDSSSYSQHSTQDGGPTYREWHGEQHTTENFNGDSSQKHSPQYGDYNRRIKAWPAEQPSHTTTQRTVRSHSVQTNFNTLPRQFGGYKQEPVAHAYGYCDL